MIDTLRSWIIGLTAASMLGLICTGITGEQSRAMKLTAGLVLLLTLLAPVGNLNGVELLQIATQAREEAQQAASGIRVQNEKLIEQLISEHTQAYILDKADSLNLKLEVEVETVQGDIYPYPAAVRLTGHSTTAQRQKLNTWIEEQLAIPEDCLTWNEAP